MNFAMLGSILLLTATLGAGDKTAAPQAGKDEKVKKSETTSEGERKFQTHCGRCHDAPEDIPRSVAGTVLKHMRVRANLTPADEKSILQYIRP
jgi:cytochrome c oxidase subunit 2